MECCNARMGALYLKIINILFMLLGLALIIPAILILADVDVINQNVLPLMQEVTFGGFNVGDLAKNLSICIIVMGMIILGISSMGAIGAFCRKPACLDIYAGIVLILFISKLFTIFLWFDMNTKLQTWIKDKMTSLLTGYYSANDLTTSQLSAAWNYLFILMSCCAVNSVNGTVNDFDNSVWVTSGASGTKHIPTFCCNGVTATSFSTHNDTTCTDEVTANFYTTGCYDAVYNILNTYSIVFIVLGFLILVIEMFAVVSATTFNHYESKASSKKSAKSTRSAKSGKRSRSGRNV